MWRSVAVEGLDEAKIEDYLTRNGITSMQEAGIRKVVSASFWALVYDRF